MKVKFLLSTVLVLAFTLAACAPQAAPTKKASVPTAVPPVTKPTTAPAATATTASKSSSTTSPKPTTAPTKSTVSATPTTAAPGSSTAVPQGGNAATPTVGPALINDIAMDDQSVSNGTVMVSMVDALQPGWVAIFTDDNGQPGKLLGYTAVPKGNSEDVKVTVDTASVTPKMIAMLLTDEGKIGTFEYPGADQPVKNANVNENVLAIFNRVSQ